MSKRKDSSAKTFGFTALAIGFFSFIYDTTNTYLSQLFDLGAMIVFVNILLYFNLEKLGVFKNSLKPLSLFSVILSMLVIFMFEGATGAFIFGSFTILVIMTEIILLNKGSYKNPKDWYFGLFLFILGFLFWIPDGFHLYCDPNGILNGRSIFHLMTALTIFFLYSFYEKQQKY